MLAPSRHRRLLLLSALVSSLTCGFTGCLSQTTFTSLANKVKQETVQLEYFLKNAKPELDPWSSFADKPLVSASWDEHDQTAVPDPSPFSAELNVEFPHPQNGTEQALATLIIYERPLPENTFQPERRSPWYKRMWPRSWSPVDDKPQLTPSEILTLDISRSQFDLLMSDLKRDDYLNESVQGKNSLPGRGEASLLVKRNDKPIHRSLVTDPRLNEFVRRIYQEGNVVLGHRETDQSIIRTAAVFEAPTPWCE
jgi:hypothetical protein